MSLAPQSPPESPNLRVAVAGLMYETNSFTPGKATLSTIQNAGWVDGRDVLTFGGGIDSISGALLVAEAENIDLVPTTVAGPMSGPTVAAGVFEALRERMISALLPLRGTVDGVYLSLHGAMVCEDQDDVEGALMREVAEVMGVPVAASFDLHTYFTDQMGEATPLIAGYHTLPHIDMVETGERAMRLLVHRLRGGNPVLAWAHIPMITSAEGQDTNEQPVRSIIDRIEQMIEHPRVLDGTLFMSQPWLDVPDHSWSALIVTDDDAELAKTLVSEIATMAWDVREKVVAPKVSVADAIQRVCELEPNGAPFVLSDGADSVSAGAAGDGVEILAALVNAPLPGPAYVIVTDAAAVARCHEAGIGATLRLDIGGTISPQFFEPTQIEGEVHYLASDGYESIYPPVHVNPGRVAVIRTANGTHAVLTERPVAQLDREAYHHVGLDLRNAHLGVAKSAGGYRAHYEPIARECIDVATRGPADSRIAELPFTRITHPVFPFEQSFAWTPEPRVSGTSAEATTGGATR